PERFEQVQEQVEQPLTGDGRHQDRNFQAPLGIAVNPHAKSLAGHYLQIERRSDRFGQPETPILSHAQMSRQLVCVHVYTLCWETGQGDAGCVSGRGEGGCLLKYSVHFSLRPIRRLDSTAAAKQEMKALAHRRVTQVGRFGEWAWRGQVSFSRSHL